jgi:nickel-dependent lactate racemase
MHLAVNYEDQRLDFELPEEHVVASWAGPAGLEPARGVEALRGALERPSDYPPLRQIVVPGDRLVIAFDQTIAPAQGVLEAVTQTLNEAGVGPSDITVLVAGDGTGLERALPAGVSLVVHDPNERSELAYLATTELGRRIYLNRRLTDADVVVPVARLGYDPLVGYRGPWSLLFPAMSDRETIKAYRSQSIQEMASHPRSKALSKLDESFEVSWLLGSQFHVGLVPGSTGIVQAVAGRETAVRDLGLDALDRHWQFRAASRADLVVVGIGQPGVPTTLEMLAAGLLTATRLVRHGGKIVVLSRASGTIGPALKGLCSLDDPREAATRLRGHETDDDYLVARDLAHALAWADIFLLSTLPEQLVQDLFLVALDSPEQARRLVAKSGSCSFVSQAELTWPVLPQDEQD